MTEQVAPGSPAVRSFLALETDDELRHAMTAAVGEWRLKLPTGRFVAPEALHLTLRFFGDTTVEQLDALRRALPSEAERCPAFDAPVTDLGMFPERGAPRILWLGVSLPTAVLDMQRACERIAVEIGFPREERPFRSHLTIARFRDRSPRPELPVVHLPPLRCRRLTLYKSDLRPTGAVYSVLGHFPLG